MLRNVTDLVGRRVQAVDGELGTVQNFYFDTGQWVIRYIAVDTGGALQRKTVLLSPFSVIESGLEAGRFSVNLTKEQVAGSPEIDIGKPLTRQLETRIAEHYHWPRYWETSPRHIGHQPGAAVAERVFTLDLAGTGSFLDHLVVASDGEVGIVKDVAVDDGSWDIRHIVVGTEGKSVLLPPKVFRYAPGEALVRVELSKAEVEHRPVAER